MISSRPFWLLLLAAAVNVSHAQPDLKARVYRDRVVPHWLPANDAFWYRNYLPDGCREFIFVDAQRGTRIPVFDHGLVAKGLSHLLEREVSAEKLPISIMTFGKDRGDVTFSVADQRFTVNRSTSQVVATTDDIPAHSSPSHFFLPRRPSKTRGDELHFTVLNALGTELNLQWIDGSGHASSYGSIKPGEQRTQHSYEGHAWVLTNAAGRDVAAFEAHATQGKLTVNDVVLRSLKEKDQRKRNKTPASPQKRSANSPVSPDQTMRAFVRDHNLWLAENGDQTDASRRQLTSDATSIFSFRKNTSRARLVRMRYSLADPSPQTPDVRWSPNSKFLLAFQATKTPEPRVHYVESTPDDQVQPQLHSYPYAKPGDPIPVMRPRLFTADGQESHLAWKGFDNPFDLQFLKWSDDSSRCWLEYNERGHQGLEILEINVNDGAVRVIVDERSDTFIHYSDSGKHVLEWLPKHQLLWASERSGWNHLYRYDVAGGALLNSVTKGDWNVRRIHTIDRDSSQIWFYAVAIIPDQNPYHEHFCRVNFDGSGFVVLTAADGTHEVTFSPDRTYLLDRYSRVDLPPVTELRRSDTGEQIVILETADASELAATESRLPLRFQAKGRDNQTDIWGIIHRPLNFDPRKHYPVVENIYAGPHNHHVPTSFRIRYRHQQQIADQGLIVVQIDGMGTAWRSKKFHDVCYKNLRDAGFPDRIAWMKAAAKKYPWMDISRVGIYGGSAGGQNALAALLWHNDFYDAAVADCGCHDNRMDKLWWNEQWMGMPGDGAYVANSNTEHVAKLQGNLMLVVGEMDRNVDPASTTQVVRRLIEADRDFEFLLMPGSGHGACEHPYASKRRASFLARHLGARPQ